MVMSVLLSMLVSVVVVVLVVNLAVEGVFVVGIRHQGWGRGQLETGDRKMC